MTDKEKQDTIQRYEREIFLIEMKDHLDSVDYSLIADYRRLIQELQEE